MGDNKLRVLLIGDSTVGKTSLLLRFTEDTFSDNPSTNGDAFKDRTFDVDGETTTLTLRDTEGEERFSGNITCSQYRGMHGLIVTFDVTNTASFGNIQHWLGELNRYSNNNMPIFILGNKTDLDQRTVTREEAEAKAKDLGHPYFETSAKTNEGVDEVFASLVREIKAKRQKPAEPAPKPSTIGSLTEPAPAPLKQKKKCSLF